MKWQQMNKEQKSRLMAYGDLLSVKNLNEDDKEDLMALAEYCLKNDLCVTAIPEKVLFTEQIKKELLNVGLTGFEAYYGNFLFVDKNGQMVDLEKVYYEQNKPEQKYLEGLRKGLNHHDATLYAYGNLSPKYE